jgi:hypothetical protein
MPSNNVVRWYRNLRQHWLGTAAPRSPWRKARQVTMRPCLEQLEDRCVPAVINVTTTADEITEASTISLRDAIIQSNTTFVGQDNVINLAAGIYNLTIAGRGEDSAATGDLDIRSNLVIQGASHDATIIDARQLDRVFEVFGASHVTFKDVVIQGGLAQDGAGFGAAGGGILIHGHPSTVVTLDNAVIDGNIARGATAGTDAFGGGIYMDSGSLNVTNNSRLTNNQALGAHGATGSNGTDGADRPDVGDTRAENGEGGGNGGNGTVGGNAHGGAVYGMTVSVAITNSWVQGNEARAGNGGAGGNGGSGGDGGNAGAFGIGGTAGRGGDGGAGAAGGSATGGGIDVTHSTLDLFNTVISTNTVQGGNGGNGGIGGLPGRAGNAGTVIDLGEDGSENYAGNCGDGAVGGSANGAGVFAINGTVTVNSDALVATQPRMIISQNTAKGGAGGAGGTAGPGHGAGGDTLEGPSGGSGGGGGEARGGGIRQTRGLLSIRNATINGNSALGGAGGGGGGGGVGGGGLDIHPHPGTSFEGTPEYDGGKGGRAGNGGQGGSAAGGGIDVDLLARPLGATPLELMAVTLSNNRAAGGAGGAGGSGGQGGHGGYDTREIFDGRQGGQGGQGGHGGRGGDAWGGGLQSSGRVELTASTVSGNLAAAGIGGHGGLGGAGGNGGGANGIFTDGGNGGAGGKGGDAAGSGLARGGGVHLDADRSWITNSTFADNIAKSGNGIGLIEGGSGGSGGDPGLNGQLDDPDDYGFPGQPGDDGANGIDAPPMGGGISFRPQQSGDRLEIVHSTIVGNAAEGTPAFQGGPPAASYFGGIADLVGFPASISIANSIVALNRALVDPNTPGAYLIGLGNNLIGVDPKLDPLSANGGLTMTMLPRADSAAIDGGNDHIAALPATDQRGVPRQSGAHVDLGAVEFIAGSVEFAVAANTTVQSGAALAYDITLTVPDGVRYVYPFTSRASFLSAFTPDPSFTTPAGWGAFYSSGSGSTIFESAAGNLVTPGTYHFTMTAQVSEPPGTVATNTFTLTYSLDGLTDLIKEIVRSTTVIYPKPQLLSISPTAVDEGSGQFILTVDGLGFGVGSQVLAFGLALDTTFVSTTQLTAVVPTNHHRESGQLSIEVFNPTPGGGLSNAIDLTVNNIAPTAKFADRSIPAPGIYSVGLTDVFDPSPADTASLHYSYALSEDALADTYATAIDGATKSFDFSGTTQVFARIFDKNGDQNTYSATVRLLKIDSATSNGPVDEGAPVTVTLTATGTAPLTYWFDFNGDSTFEVNNSGGIATHTFADDGTYIVPVRVTDSFGGQVNSSITITVNNLPPTANAGGPYEVVEGGSIVLTGTGSDPAGTLDPLRFEWDLNYNGVTFNENAYGAAPTFSGLDGPSTRTIALRTRDDSDAVSAISTATVTIENAKPQIASVSSSGPVGEGLPITVTVTASDPAGDLDPLTYWFDFGDDTGEVSSSTGSAQHTYADDDEDDAYTVTVRVTDGDGGEAVGSTTVTVNNRPPTIATLTAPATGKEGAEIQLSVTASDPAGASDPLRYAWTITGPNGFRVNLDTASASFTPDEDGLYTVSLVVSDGDAGTATQSTTIEVENVAPTAQFVGRNPATGTPGQPLTFTLGATDPSSVDQNAGFRYVIDWGDDTQTETNVPQQSGWQEQHIWGTAGTYTVTLTAIDQDDGSSSTVKHTVVIGRVGQGNDPTDPTKQALYIGGTNGNDIIQLRKSGAGVMVVFNGKNLGTFNPTGRIYVYGLAGNDRIELDKGLARDAILDGGAGNDILIAGAGSDVLLGGEGDDTLQGQLGHNLLIGGAGKDALWANAQNAKTANNKRSMLLGGTTNQDGDLAALAAVLNEMKTGPIASNRLQRHNDSATDTLYFRLVDQYFVDLGDKATRVNI